MELTDFIGAKNAIVQIVIGEQVIEFNTNIIKRHEDGIYITPYLYNGKILDMNITPGKGIVCNIFGDSPADGSRISFRNLELSSITNGDNPVYYVRTSGFNRFSNNEERRNHQRVKIHKAGSVIDKSTGIYTDVIIHDISDNGVAFYAPPSFAPSSYLVKVTFNDYIDGQEFSIKTDCKISRSVNKLGNVLYGCRIDVANRDLAVYLFLKRTENKPSEEEGK